MRPRHRSVPSIVLATVVVLSVAGAAAQEDLRRPEEQLAAIYALRVLLDIEQRTLDEALQYHNDLARLRTEARERVGRMYRDLDAMVEGRVEATPEEIFAREQDVARAEQALATIGNEGRVVRVVVMVPAGLGRESRSCSCRS